MSAQSVKARTSQYGLTFGDPNLKSIGSITFGPDGILFAADSVGAAIFALDVDDDDEGTNTAPVNIENIDARLASYLGCAREDVLIKDMAVHPTSRNIYLSVMRGRGSDALPVIITCTPDGKLSAVSLEGISYAKHAISDAPAPDDARTEGRVIQGNREGEERVGGDGATRRFMRDPLRTITVTDIAYIDGVVLVAGASNEEFSSTLRRIPFPFQSQAISNSLEIYHVSHSKYETAAPIRTFVPYGSNSSILASYTCTPVVHFSLADIMNGAQAKGRTVAELGAGNTPLDMVSYQREGKEYLLVSNARHPLMKIACADIDVQEGLTQPKEPVGVPREHLSHQGVGKMATWPGGYVLMLQQDEAGNTALRSYSNTTL